MSKERARRRAAREAESARRVAAAEARNERQVASSRRRARRAAVLRSVAPRGQRFTRRTREQRAIIVVLLLAIAVGSYVLLDSWAPRVGVMLLALIATPAIATMILDRGSR